MPRRALLVIDVQQGLCDDASRPFALDAALAPAQVIAHQNDVLANLSSFGPRVRPVPAADVTFVD